MGFGKSLPRCHHRPPTLTSKARAKPKRWSSRPSGRSSNQCNEERPLGGSVWRGLGSLGGRRSARHHDARPLAGRGDRCRTGHQGTILERQWLSLFAPRFPVGLSLTKHSELIPVFVRQETRTSMCQRRSDHGLHGHEPWAAWGQDSQPRFWAQSGVAWFS